MIVAQMQGLQSDGRRPMRVCHSCPQQRSGQLEASGLVLMDLRDGGALPQGVKSWQPKPANPIAHPTDCPMPPGQVASMIATLAAGL